MQQQKVYKQSDRADLVSDADGQVMRKTARIIALQMHENFVVYTDRGPMQGAPGDWLATNHPHDDAGSDMWVISDERMRQTYERVGG